MEVTNKKKEVFLNKRFVLIQCLMHSALLVLSKLLIQLHVRILFYSFDLFLRETEREREREGGREGEREKIIHRNVKYSFFYNGRYIDCSSLT